MKQLTFAGMVMMLLFTACVPQRQFQDVVAARDKCLQDTAVMASGKSE